MLRFLCSILVTATLAHSAQPIPSQQRIERLASKKGSFSNSERGDIENYVKNWIKTLQEGEKEKISLARRKLAAPLTKKNLSNSFRVTITSLSRKKLENILNQTFEKHDPTTSLRRLNTYTLLSLLGSEEVTWSLTGLANKKPPKDALEHSSLAKAIATNMGKTPEPRASNICDSIQALEKIKKWIKLNSVKITNTNLTNDPSFIENLEKKGLTLGSIFECFHKIAQIKSSKIEGRFDCKNNNDHQEFCFFIEIQLIKEILKAASTNWSLYPSPLIYALHRSVKNNYQLITQSPSGKLTKLHKENIVLIIETGLSAINFSNAIPTNKKSKSGYDQLAGVFKDLDSSLNWSSQLLNSTNQTDWTLESEWVKNQIISEQTINRLKKLQSAPGVQ